MPKLRCRFEAPQIKGSHVRKEARRATQNALKHGLSTVRRNSPIHYSQVAGLAHALCGDDKDPQMYEAALELAQSIVFLREIQNYQGLLIERLSNPANFQTTAIKREFRYSAARSKRRVALAHKALLLMPRNGASPRGTEFDQAAKALLKEPLLRKPASVLEMALPELVRVARYERYAWRMWNRGFERFVKAKRQQLRDTPA